MNTHIDKASEKIKDIVSSIDQYELTRPSSSKDYYEKLYHLEDFIGNLIDPLHDELYQICNLFEDHFRSIYIYMDDATMEGHVTELEAQLSQLRMVNEGFKSLPSEFNDEMGDLSGKYYTMLNSLLDSRKMLHDVHDDISINDHISNLESSLLLRPGYLHMKDVLKTIREACVKLLSIFAMMLGKWEKKIEDRVDIEHIEDGMIMTNLEKGKTLSSKKGKRKQSNFYN